MRNREQIKWCACEGHNAADWTAVADFYAKHFIPEKWMFEYRMLACHEDDRILYIVGMCNHCGGFMRSGISVPTNIKGDELLAYVYREMTSYRPYDCHDADTDIYRGCVSQRAKWYQRQDDLTLEERNQQFQRLFSPVDQPTVVGWLARN